jgi:hypothetical protein
MLVPIYTGVASEARARLVKDGCNPTRRQLLKDGCNPESSLWRSFQVKKESKSSEDEADSTEMEDFE